MLRKVFLLCLATLCLLWNSNAMAGGGQSYPNGAEAFMAGAVPPPGNYFLDYAYYYSADTMKDDNGDAIGAFDDVSILANVFRYLWVSDTEIMGANLAMHALIANGKTAVPALMEVLSDAPQTVRINAIRALAEIQDQRAIPVLMSALEEESVLLQHWAEEGLERLGLNMIYMKPE